MKRCPNCQFDKPTTEFCRSSKNRDGLQGWCKDCCRIYMSTRPQSPERRRANAYASTAKYPERRRAREKVKDAVRSGKLPPVSTRICRDCGQPAKAYDHVAGYDQPLIVDPVCSICHGRRSRVRGEHKRAAPHV